jgi:hypothetical protein
VSDYRYEIEHGIGGEWVILEWTTNPPTQEGWYWVCVEDGHISATFIHNGADPKLMGDNVYWLGPLPVPEPPK